jgi:hypothetical protein
MFFHTLAEKSKVQNQREKNEILIFTANIQMRIKHWMLFKSFRTGSASESLLAGNHCALLGIFTNVLRHSWFSKLREGFATGI